MIFLDLLIDTFINLIPVFLVIVAGVIYNLDDSNHKNPLIIFSLLVGVSFIGLLIKTLIQWGS